MFLSRNVAPCGTVTAYNRHRRNKETPCEPCRRANAEDKRDRKRADRAVEVAAFHDSVDEVEPVVEADDVEVDPLAEALDSLQLVRRALHSDQTMPKDIGPLTRRRDELVDRIKGLEKAAAPAEVSVFDELEQKREASRTRNTG